MLLEESEQSTNMIIIFRINALLVVEPEVEQVTFDTVLDINTGEYIVSLNERQMDDKLLNYYENELTFIRKMGVEFAKKHPDLARMLLLERDRCSDPHTERLIEAFAFISGRIHKKIDDDFPEIIESFFSILYPHYINPIPSMSVVKFYPALKDISETGYEIEKKNSCSIPNQ